MSVQLTKELNAYSAAFLELQERSAASGSASWINRLRETAFDSFERLGLPTTRDEEW